MSVRIIPVLDLMGGLVVRGVGGRRDEYRPIQSRLCADPSPASVARALVEHWSPSEAYVADLDAIAGAAPAWDVYQAIAACGLALWVDAGLSDVARAVALAEFAAAGRPLSGLVAGLESLPSPAVLADMLAAVGPERLIFSLDLKAGMPVTSGPGWSGRSAEAIADLALELGVRRLIVLDLARVGMGGGVGTEALCRRLRDRDADLEIIAGGGVRGIDDLNALAAAGCDGALVASALHDGGLGTG